MSNSFIELNAGSGGKKLDSEQLTVASQIVQRERMQIAGLLPLEVGVVLAALPGAAAYAAGVRPIMHRSTVQAFFAAEVLDASPTEATSVLEFDCSQYRKAVVYLGVTVTNSPSQLRVIVEYSDDGGTDWFEYEDDGWGEKVFLETTSYKKALRLETLGREIRFRVVGTGTDATNTYSINLTAEFQD